MIIILSPWRKMAATRVNVFLAIVAMATMVELGMAKNITVGTPGGGWKLNSNLASWASGQTFTQGDNLIFSYDASMHDVLEVNKADYDSCSASNPMDTHKTGNDVIPLLSTGKRYFICGTAGHCTAGGMKVEIDIVAASMAPSPSGSSPPSPSGTPSPPGKSGASGRALGAKVAAGFGLGMLMVLAH